MKDKIIKVLKKVPDPELGISVWDLGLIYNVKVKGKKVEVLMTLTTPLCPLIEEIQKSVKKEIERIKGVDEVVVELTFEPAWSFRRISKKGQKQLGFG